MTIIWFIYHCCGSRADFLSFYTFWLYGQTGPAWSSESLSQGSLFFNLGRGLNDLIHVHYKGILSSPYGLHPWLRANNFTTLIKGFMEFITMHLFFSLFGGSEDDICKYRIFAYLAPPRRTQRLHGHKIHNLNSIILDLPLINSCFI